ncbi:hypothetical protein AJ80_04059 [Polytolypa hystricis UAMH7299]|uniref:NAD(P)-binding protein n=1 Tax=Polytolypa hystricis (strain UAMH7299) TaxID=1447883 RepID=A0A2B7YCQ4_POLH7|nr:hypothetical protein AJ80_04059 [Polytolypa hystricis UAMH7299]
MSTHTNRVYAITGLSGIGLSTAALLHSQGAYLSLADISRDSLSNAIAVICPLPSSSPAKIMTTVLDVRDRAAVDTWIASTISRFGRLDGAANMAGVIGADHGMKGLIESDDDDAQWDMIMSVNLTGLMYCMRAQIRAMMGNKGGEDRGLPEGEGKGSIVNASSIQGLIGFKNHAAYSASKHGVIGLSRSVAKEVGPGVRVNCVAPGSIQTPLLDKANAIQGVTTPEVPSVISRPGTANEVAQVVCFLLSDAASYITGSVQSVDGGWQ